MNRPRTVSECGLNALGSVLVLALDEARGTSRGDNAHGSAAEWSFVMIRLINAIAELRVRGSELSIFEFRASMLLL